MLSIAEESSTYISQNFPVFVSSYTIPWPQKSKLAFLRRANGQPRYYWESEQQDFGFAGFGNAILLTRNGEDRFEEIRKQVDILIENSERFGEVVPGICSPRFFGGFSFKPRLELESESCWRGFPSAAFVLPRFVLTHFGDRAWLTVNAVFNGDTESDQRIESLRDLLWNLPDLRELPTKNGIPKKHLMDRKDLVAYDDWEYLVQRVIRQIKTSKLDKVVLSRSREIRVDGPVSILSMLSHLKVKYPDCYRFLFEYQPGHVFIGATPELLVQVDGQMLNTVALAGSLKRGNSYQEDQALGQQLLSNQKDLHEHNIVIQAIKEALQAYSTEIEIAPFPRLMRLNNVQHLVTSIKAELSNKGGILPLVSKLHPTPAVGGLPRDKALEYIQKHEFHDRGWYTGPIGWFDSNGNGVFSVALRSAICVDQVFTLFAGAGIVGKSEPDKEWRETEWKFQPIEDAIMNGMF